MQSMQDRRLLWLLGTLAALLSVLLVPKFFEWMDDTTLEARFNKIQAGMTLKQVERLVGQPSRPPSPGSDGISNAAWRIPGQCVFYVWFDEEEKVINKEVREGNLQRKASLNDLMNEFLRRIGL